jgi:hypothetical protein
MYMKKQQREDINSLVLMNRVATRQKAQHDPDVDFEAWRTQDVKADSAQWGITILLGLDHDGHAREMLETYAETYEDARHVLRYYVS